jgi:hypothetical protein
MVEGFCFSRQAVATMPGQIRLIIINNGYAL